MARELKKIKEIEEFSIYPSEFFIKLAGKHPMLSSDFDPYMVGLDYLQHSGDKYATKIIDLVYSTDTQTPARAQKLAEIVSARYGQSWDKVYTAMTSEYDPIENYKMNEKKIKDSETTTFGKTIGDDDTITFGKKVDDTSETEYGRINTIEDNHSTTRTGGEEQAHEVTQDTTTITPGITTTREGGVYGYNSSTEVPSDKSTESRTGEDEQTHTLSETDTTTYNSVKDDYTGEVTSTDGGKDNVTRGSEESGTETHQKVYNEGGTEKIEREYEFERRGNIGVTTSQQMLESELELRKWSFLEMVFSDCDKVLCLETY